MAEYIECEALLDYIDNRIPKLIASSDGKHIVYVETIREVIVNFPAADVAPVRHGHWKKVKGNERPTENGFVHDDRYICDCCGWGCCCDTKLDFRYCPNCGAKMVGGEGE